MRMIPWILNQVQDDEMIQLFLEGPI